MAKVEADRYITLLDRLHPNHVGHAKRMQYISRRRESYRQFILDHSAAKWLSDNINEEMAKLLEEQMVFAKPPFPNVAIEFPLKEPIMMLMSEDGKFDLILYHVDEKQETIYRVPASIDFLTGEIVDVNPNDTYAKTMDGFKANLKDSRIWMAMFFLMLHRKRAVQTTDKARVSIKQQGRRRVFMAHSTVSIDLLAFEEDLKRNVETGARGGYRAHEVRGTWANYDRNPNCDHEWQEVESEDDIPRYFCIKCSQRRSWRKAHVRGDATLGWVRKQYSVTAKGVDQ